MVRQAHHKSVINHSSLLLFVIRHLFCQIHSNFDGDRDRVPVYGRPNMNSVVSINEPLNLLTMKKIMKKNHQNRQKRQNHQKRRFSVIRHSSLIIRHCISVIHILPNFEQLSNQILKLCVDTNYKFV
jgi:hypothetical protein